MDRFQLGMFQLTRNPQTSDLLLMVTGPTRYKSVLNQAFPALSFSRSFPDRFGHFDWGTYVKQSNPPLEAELRAFCLLLQQTIFIEDDLDECFALSFHTQTSVSGGYERSRFGQLVREAKPYDRGGSPGNRDKAIELANHLAEFISRHPTYRRAECLVAVPPSNPAKAFDLPMVLVEQIASITGQLNASEQLQKTRNTKPMKECRTIQEKIENLRDAFTTTSGSFEKKKVLIIDDIYQSGFSMNEVGRCLRESGAGNILGLAVTKTATDLSETEDLSEIHDHVPF